MYAMMGYRPMAGAGRFMDAGVGLGVHTWFAHVAFMLLVVAGIALVVWALRRKPGHALASAPSAVDAASAIARERLARGEIEPEQYLAIVAALNGRYGVDQPSTPPGNVPPQG